MIVNEPQLAFLSAAAGLVFGLLWNLADSLRRGKLSTFWWDVFLLALLGVWNFLFLLYWCDGFVRGFVFCLEGMGLCLYRLLLHPITVFLKRIVSAILRVTFCPIKWILRKFFYKPVFLFKILFQKVKKTLKSSYAKVYNHYIFPLRQWGKKGRKRSDEQEKRVFREN